MPLLLKRRKHTLLRIPIPSSAGLILSYKCPAECRHCMYACSPKWDGYWMGEDRLYQILTLLSGKIKPAPWGPETLGLSHGLHITGGEPFLNYELLSKAVRLAGEMNIPSLFAETNCFWCSDDDVTREKMLELKSNGMHGIMVSVNPFFLEYVPFERTERAVRIGHEIFGRNLMVYQVEYYRRFAEWGLAGRVALDEYLEMENKETLARNVEFFVMGRAPFHLAELLKAYVDTRPAEFFFRVPCSPSFIRDWHNHFDNYGNFIPGFCGGISLGDWSQLDSMIDDGIDMTELPVLSMLANNDFKGLYRLARDHGFEQARDGYLSKCHLCMDMRRSLYDTGGYSELAPAGFYEHLTA